MQAPSSYGDGSSYDELGADIASLIGIWKVVESNGAKSECSIVERQGKYGWEAGPFHADLAYDKQWWSVKILYGTEEASRAPRPMSTHVRVKAETDEGGEVTLFMQPRFEKMANTCAGKV